MKYLVYRDGDVEHLVTFPRSINHDRMAEAMSALRFGSDQNWHRRQGQVVAAGFVVGGSCQGHSESLGIGSRGAVDTALLQAQY
ncbi:hypothetical protein ABIC83_002879 [Roseateles asaccharophilus]|uniref:hypothetical protein n=1 Tax=Roseateles asaccharophilus TaxID=582607 RepID=UPI003835A220